MKTSTLLTSLRAAPLVPALTMAAAPDASAQVSGGSLNGTEATDRVVTAGSDPVAHGRVP